MNRRSFLRSILAAGIAPYVVTSAGVLMPVRQRIVVPDIWRDVELTGLTGVDQARRIARTELENDRIGHQTVAELLARHDELKATMESYGMTIVTAGWMENEMAISGPRFRVPE